MYLSRTLECATTPKGGARQVAHAGRCGPRLSLSYQYGIMALVY